MGTRWVLASILREHSRSGADQRQQMAFASALTLGSRVRDACTRTVDLICENHILRIEAREA